MQFLSDVYLRCPDCDGKRYRPEILEVTIERRLRRAAAACLNVADVLDLTVSEAAALFANDREVIRALQPIVDVGLEYVKLGQPVPTLVRRRIAAPQARRLPGAGREERQRQPAGASPRAARCSCSTSRPPACTSTTSPS